MRYEPEKSRIFADNYFGKCITTGGTETKKDITVTNLGDVYKISGNLTLIENGKISKAYTQKDIDLLTYDLSRALKQAKLWQLTMQIVKIAPVVLAAIVAIIGIRKSIAHVFDIIRNA